MNDHPSGKDRTQEPGTSNTQGKSTSDPDGDTNGGADKPGGDGGFDDDKDGNNGCGNDDDFEDDNNGNCGGGANARGAQKQKQGEGAEVQGGEVRKLHGNVAEHKVDVETDGARSVQGAPTAAVQAVEDTRVLGVSLVREPAAAAAVSGVAAAGRGAGAQAAPAALAATGAPAVELMAVAFLLIASGLAFVAGARRREASLA